MARSGDCELYRVGDLVLDVEAGLLTRHDLVVHLPPKTFELFAELVRRAPGVVRRQELIDAVWPHELVNDEALTQRVMLLRRTLGDDPKDPSFIASVPRWGYRIVAPVERLEGDGARPLTARPAANTTLSGLERTIASIRRRDRRVARVALALVTVVVGAVLYLELARMRRPVDSLAIVPFATTGAGSDDEVLAEGIPATLTAAMTQVPDLRVIASGTMARYRGRVVDPQAVGRELGVRAVLTGRLARRGSLLVIDTELVDVRDGSLLWSARLERQLTDIFAVENELSSEIASGMSLTLTGAQRSRLARRTTRNVDAYTLYLRARHSWNRREAKGFAGALASFRAATERDPSYALPWVGLADCYALQGSMEYGITAPNDSMPKARGAAARALALDPDLAEAHASLGLVLWLYDWERGEAEQELRRAVELNPGYASAHQWLGEMLAEVGRSNEAGREIRRAGELDPLSLVISADRGLLAYYRRDFSTAVDRYHATLRMDPTFLQARLGLGLAELQLGERERAVAVLAEANRLAGSVPPALGALGYAYGVAGRAADARAVLAQLLALRNQRYVSAFYVAGVFIGLGDRDSAFAWLDRACDERAGLLGALDVWPAFDPLRSDPRFAALRRRVNLR